MISRNLKVIYIAYPYAFIIVFYYKAETCIRYCKKEVFFTNKSVLVGRISNFNSV
jgi:hypothetical protein